MNQEPRIKKTSIKSSCLFFVFSCFLLTQKSFSQDMCATCMRRNFYKAYLFDFAKPDNTNQITHHLEVLRSKYLTLKGRSQYKQIVIHEDVDPIIKAQDGNAELLKTLKIKAVDPKINIYEVSYYINTSKENITHHRDTITIKLSIIRTKTGYKIDSFL